MTESAAITLDLAAMVAKTNADLLLASLRAVLPFAESRAEDMVEIAEEAEAESRATAADAREDADKAVAAVDDAKALLASLGAEG